MPLPPGLARFNRVATNRITGRFARSLPWFGVLHHRGRRSGREYHTPLNAWSDDESVVVALTYGDRVDWLANARSAGGANITMRGKELNLGRPRHVSREEGMTRMPGLVAAVLPLIGVDQFVVFPIRGRQDR
jgi:deazaflavin-dependent oxidoreductase (nitroreductase family)